jgi:hypothetical protein
MKKLSFYFIALLFVALNVNQEGFAQKHADLQMSIATPSENEIIPYGDTVLVKILVKNLGPDTLRIGSDSVFFTGTLFPWVTSINWANLAPMDTAIFLFLYDENIGNPEDESEHLCSYFLPFSSTYIDTNQDNDTACISFIMKGSGHTGISNNELNTPKGFELFPNPGAQKVNIKFYLSNAEKVTIKIRNLIGRQVMETDYRGLSGTLNKELDVSRLSPGIYFVSIAAGEKRWVQKLSVQ